MTVTYLGELTLDAAVPLLADFSVALQGANAFALPEINAKLTGLGNVLSAITVAPPSLGATIVAAQQTVLSLQAAIGGPTVTLQAASIAAQISDLTAMLGDLVANAALAIPSASVSVFAFDGAAASLGVELQSAVDLSLPGAGSHANALILATKSSSAWTAMQGVFAT